MKVYKREIVIIILTTLATVATVCYFFRDMEKSKMLMQTDLYSLTASNPEAILAVNRPEAFTRLSLTKKKYQSLASKIPEIYLLIIRQNPEISSFHLSFHPQGVVLYVKAATKSLRHIEEIVSTVFKSFAPQQQSKGGITFTYYPDAENRFFGYYYYNGIWIASHSKKLLEEVAGIQKKERNNLQQEQTQVRKRLDKHAPINLIVQSNVLKLYVEAHDSTLWKVSDRWLGIDLFESKGSLCYFGNLPFHEPADTLLSAIADTFSVRLKQHFPQLHISNRMYEENGKLYYTGCTE